MTCLKCSVRAVQAISQVKDGLLDSVQAIKVGLETSVTVALAWAFDEPDIFAQFKRTDGSTSFQDIYLAEYAEKIKSLKNRKNFASGSSGSNVLSNTDGITNRGAILKSDPTLYMTIGECNNGSTETVVINLSDDVQIDAILVSNSEDFSAQLGEIAFYGSIDFPPKDDKWMYLGTLYPE